MPALNDLVMVDVVELTELRDQLAESVRPLAWRDDPPDDYAEVRGILTYGHPVVDARLMDRLPGLRVISNFGVGYDHIDARAAAERGIRVGNTPGVLDAATADLGMTLLLAAARNLKPNAAYYSTWLAGPPKIMLGSDLQHRTLGILGLGRIGRQVARRAAAFDMRVIYHSRRPVDQQQLEPLAGGTTPSVPQYAEFDQLLAESDFVMLTLPLTSDTFGLLGWTALARMKPTAQLINIARGAIVDTDALTEALREGVIAGAALDVTDPEPLPADHPLRSMPNVLLTPHLGSATWQTRRAMGRMTLDNLLAGLRGLPMPHEVIFER